MSKQRKNNSNILKKKMKKWVAGRYGMDDFNIFLLVIAIIFTSMFYFIGELFFWEGLILFLFVLYRMTSRDFKNRLLENDGYLRFLRFLRNKYRKLVGKPQISDEGSINNNFTVSKDKETTNFTLKNKKTKVEDINISKRGKRELRKEEKEKEEKQRRKDNLTKQQEKEKKKYKKNLYKNAKSDGYLIFDCEKCGQKLRLPAGKGKIEISCPKCKSVFIKKT